MKPAGIGAVDLIFVSDECCRRNQSGPGDTRKILLPWSKRSKNSVPESIRLRFQTSNGPELLRNRGFEGSNQLTVQHHVGRPLVKPGFAAIPIQTDRMNYSDNFATGEIPRRYTRLT